VEGTRAVALAASASGAHLVHVSSLAAAGPAAPGSPRSEDDRPQPITPYGVSKLAGEQAVRDTGGLEWTILRPGVVYGPEDTGLLTLFRMADRGILPLVGRRGAAYTFIHIDDMIRTIEAALERRATGRTIFVGHAQPVAPRQLLEAIRAAVGRPAVIVPVPLPIARGVAAAGDFVGGATGRPQPLDTWRYTELAARGFVCRVEAMRQLLGVQAEVGLAEGLADTAEWYRREGWIRRARPPTARVT
jgi:nucleoside-diphosphate-sugar epimerase